MKSKSLYLGLAALTISFYSCNKEPVQKSLPEAPAAPAPVDTTPEVREYVVKEGDTPWKIIRSLNSKGAVYSWRKIQSNTWDAAEIEKRDIYTEYCSDYLNSPDAVGITCPNPIPGKDGLADILHPGEILKIR